MFTTTRSYLLCSFLFCLTWIPTSNGQADESIFIAGIERGVGELFDEQFPLIIERFTTNGQATHLGNYTSVGFITINVVTGEIVEANQAFTAENGDQLFANLQMKPLGPDRAFIVGTVTGGTGRFLEASGVFVYLLETEQPFGEFPNRFRGLWFGSVHLP